MTGIEFKERIEKSIRLLSDQGRLNFALDVCIRLLPEYRKFHHKNNWGDPDILAQGIAYCQGVSGGENPDVNQINHLTAAIDSVTPDTEDFGDYDGSYALNACLAIGETLTFLKDKSIDHILDVSSFMTDTIDFQIFEAFGELPDHSIDTHPWILDERNRQIELTKKLQRRSD